jgi:hypothetical protein
MTEPGGAELGGLAPLRVHRWAPTSSYTDADERRNLRQAFLELGKAV